MVSKPEPQVPSSSMVAQKLAERAARAAALVAQWEAERDAGVSPESRSLALFRWEPLSDPVQGLAHLVVRGASGQHRVKVGVYAPTPGDPLRVFEARCDCPDSFGHTWCGSCKHELAARALVSRALACGCGPRPPVPPAVAAARADALARHGVVFPFPSPADHPAVKPAA